MSHLESIPFHLRRESHRIPNRCTPTRVRFASRRLQTRRLHHAAISCAVSACSQQWGPPHHVWGLLVLQQGKIDVSHLTHDTDLSWSDIRAGVQYVVPQYLSGMVEAEVSSACNLVWSSRFEWRRSGGRRQSITHLSLASRFAVCREFLRRVYPPVRWPVYTSYVLLCVIIHKRLWSNLPKTIAQILSRRE